MQVYVDKEIVPNGAALIIGGGVSVNEFPVGDFVSKYFTLGVNDSFLLDKDIDVCWFGDAPWFESRLEKLLEFKGEVWTCHSSFHDHPTVKYVPKGKAMGIDLNRISWNRNSGASAINLAVLMGAKKILLAGFDLKLGKEGQANWHNNYNRSPFENMEEQYKRWDMAFKVVSVDAQKYGIEIINLNQDSALEYFPKADWKTYL